MRACVWLWVCVVALVFLCVCVTCVSSCVRMATHRSVAACSVGAAVCTRLRRRPLLWGADVVVGGGGVRERGVCAAKVARVWGGIADVDVVVAVVVRVSPCEVVVWVACAWACVAERRALVGWMAVCHGGGCRSAGVWVFGRRVRV